MSLWLHSRLGDWKEKEFQIKLKLKENAEIRLKRILNFILGFANKFYILTFALDDQTFFDFTYTCFVLNCNRGNIKLYFD